MRTLKEKKEKKYFVSYARGDSASAEELLKALDIHFQLSKKFHYNKWIDDDILPDNTQGYHPQIVSALEESDFALVLATPRYFTRDYILKNELPPLLRNEGRKLAVIVGMEEVDFGHHDLKGFEKFQFHRLDSGKYYSQCTPQQKKEFVHSLFRKIEMILERSQP